MTKMSSLNYMELCRLCLVKEKVSVPIFEGEGGERQIFDKIATCLPVKVSQDDKLPKKICSDCVYRVENSYQFWNTTSNSEKQLLEWVVNDDVKVDTKSNLTMETEQLVLKEETIDHDQTAADVAKSLSRVEAVLTEETGQPGGGVSEEEEEEEESDDGGGGGGGEDSNSEESGEEPPGKEEIESEEEEEEEEPYEELEPTTFVNVSLACDEAGPSGIQQTRQQTKQDSQASAASASATTENAEAPSTSAADPAASGVPSTSHKVYRGTYVGNPNHYVLVGSTELPVHMSSQTWLETMTTALTSTTPGVRLKNYHCLPCNTSFISSSELKNHNVIHQHFINKCNSTQQPIDTTSRSSIKNQGGINISDSYPCVQCDKSFKNQYLFNRHNAANHSFNKCNICGKQFNKPLDYKLHMKRFVNTKHFACDHCNATFKDECNLMRHEQIHTGDKSYVCRFCNYSAYTITKINNHERRHTGNFRHYCKVCNKGYNSLQNLESHNISLHSADPHKCAFCGKLYTSKYRYRRHLLEHKPNYIPENKFQCDTCGQTFKRAPILKKHMVCHLAVKPYECNQCGKRVTRKSSLENHIRTHTGERPAVCNVCGKAFASPYLATHMRSHTGAKPFTCTTCDKSFTQRSTLVIHQRSHTGLRPYQCPTCSKDFVTKTLLKYHQKVHLK